MAQLSQADDDEQGTQLLFNGLQERVQLCVQRNLETGDRARFLRDILRRRVEVSRALKGKAETTVPPATIDTASSEQMDEGAAHAQQRAAPADGHQQLDTENTLETKLKIQERYMRLVRQKGSDHEADLRKRIEFSDVNEDVRELLRDCVRALNVSVVDGIEFLKENRLIEVCRQLKVMRRSSRSPSRDLAMVFIGLPGLNRLKLTQWLCQSFDEF